MLAFSNLDCVDIERVFLLAVPEPLVDFSTLEAKKLG